jgi:hypothetical protein
MYVCIIEKVRAGMNKPDREREIIGRKKRVQRKGAFGERESER